MRRPDAVACLVSLSERRAAGSAEWRAGLRQRLCNINRDRLRLESTCAPQLRTEPGARLPGRRSTAGGATCASGLTCALALCAEGPAGSFLWWRLVACPDGQSVSGLCSCDPAPTPLCRPTHVCAPVETARSRPKPAIPVPARLSVSSARHFACGSEGQQSSAAIAPGKSRATPTLCGAASCALCRAVAAPVTL